MTKQEPAAVSPAIGPLPPVYVPPAPGPAGPADLLWQAMVRAVRRALHRQTPARED